MAVVWTKQTGVREFSDDGTGALKAQRVYLVLCGDKNDDPDVAAVSVPGVGYAFNATYPNLVGTNRQCRMKERTGDGGILYEVTVDFATRRLRPAQAAENPLDRPAVVKLGRDTFEETRYAAPTIPEVIDADGNPVGSAVPWPWGTAVCNSSGKPFNPSVTDSFRDPVLTVTRNLAELPWDFQIEYDNAVNSDDFDFTYRGNTYHVAKGQAWLYEVSSEPRYENGVAYEEATLVIKLRKDGWKRRILDQGLEQWSGPDDDPNWHKVIPITNARGDPVQQPALLNGGGKPLGKDDPPVFLQWQFKNEKEFASIPFFA